MDIKILTSITELSGAKRNSFVIGTHDGMFHSDDVVAVAIMCIIHQNEKICVVRTRKSNVLNECDICVDIGGGKYDHHKPGFDLRRESGIIYASAGLVWKDFGEEVVLKIVKQNNLKEELWDYRNDIMNAIDANLIKYVDAEDNGIDLGVHHMSFISSYLPKWYEIEPNFNLQFVRVLNTTIAILEQEINRIIGEVYATNEINKRIKSSIYISNCILEIPSQTMPWIETICCFNEVYKYNDFIKFVIFPHPSGGWAAQCVPPSAKERFKQIIPFPKFWAGKTNELARISGVDDAIFCHNGCFFVQATTRNGVIKMCEIAMETSNSK